MHSVLAIQRLLALLALALFGARAATLRSGGGPRAAQRAPRSLRWFAGGVAGAFAVTAGWQGFWTLRPEEAARFRAVQRHDTRLWKAEVVAARRTVTDRAGVVLAHSQSSAEGTRRWYPLGPAASHVTGYYHPRYGLAGIEAACDSQLATWGRPAVRQLWPGRDGRDRALALTLDARLQRAAARALAGRRGAVVVLNPAAGDVLVLASSPSVDPNRLDPAAFAPAAGDGPRPLLNRALHGLYAPGSTFKPLVAALALSAGLGTQTEFVEDPRGYLPPFDTQRIQDYDAAARAARPARRLTMPEAMARSANGYFAWLGVQLGDKLLVRGAEALGLTRSWDLGAGGPFNRSLASTPGRLPAAPMKPGDLARTAIGQHRLLVTPFGLAVAAATLANYGDRVAPRLRRDVPPAAPERVVSAEVAGQVQELMRGVVVRPGGTGAGLRGLGVDVAAKTGSAENPHGAAHAWVMAFAPARQATLALVVLVEHGGTGSAAAVPVAREVLQAAGEAGYFRPARNEP